MGLVTLATRWHGDNEPGTVYTKSREPGTRKPQTLELHPFLHPEPKEQPGTSKAGRGVSLSLSLSLLERELLLLCLVLGLPVQAELPQITLGVCFQCGVEDEAAVPSQESRNWFHLLSWDAHRSFIHIRMVGLEPSQLQTGPAGARTRRVSISSSHGYIMARELLFEALGFFYSS